MAGQSVIGALRVVLGIDTAALDKGLKNARTSLAGFGNSAKLAGAVIAGALAGAVGGLAVAIKHSIDNADNLGKMSQKIGIPVEELSALKHAADLSDVSLESLQKSVAKLSRTMVEAAAKPAAEAANSFRALGISVTGTDGKLKSSSQVMTEVAGKFEGMKDGVGKTAIAMAMFGRSGADLIPMLNAGKAGLAAMMQEAAELGIVIDTQTAKSAEAFNDNLTRLGKVWDGLVLKITAEMLPAFLQFSQIMIDASKNAQLVKDVAEGIVTGLKGVVSVVIQVVTTFQRLGAELNALVGAMKLFKTQAEADAAWAKFRAEGKKTEETFKTMNTFVERFWSDAAAGAAAAAPAVKKGLTDINIAAVAGKNALDGFLDSTNKRTAAMMAEVQTIGLGTFAREKLRIALEAETIAKDKNIKITDALRMRLEQVGEAYALMADKIEGKRIWESMRTAAEQFGLAMEDLNGKFSRGALDADTYARAVAVAQDKLISANTHAQNMGRSLETAFDKALDGGQKLGDIMKSLIQDFIKMEARSAFRTLLSGNAGSGGSFSGILGSLFGAAGGMPAGATGVVGSAGSMAVPTFAGGGIIPAGGLGLVSEHAPGGGRFIRAGNEPITVSPNDVGGGGGDTITVTIPIDARGAQAGVAEQIQAAMRQVPTMAVKAILDAKSRNTRGLARI